MILPLLDLLAYVAESVRMTFEYDLIPDVDLAILTPFSKGGDNARDRLRAAGTAVGQARWRTVGRIGGVIKG